MNSVLCAGSKVYVTDGYVGVRIIDISTPSEPFTRGGIDTPGNAWGLALTDTHVLVADTDKGMQVIPLQCLVATSVPPASPGSNDASSDPVTVSVRPNPVREGAVFALDVPRGGDLHVELFDATGRRVREMRRHSVSRGGALVRWDGRDDAGRPVASGLYFARVSWPGGASVARVTVSR
jgi:hypothetical protein